VSKLLYIVLPWKCKFYLVQKLRACLYKPKTDKGRSLVAYRKLKYFPTTPRMQRLFISPKTTEHMAWYHLHDAIDRIIVQLSDGEAWKHFNRVHPQFSRVPRNVYRGLCTDGFQPFGSFVAPYSCWPVILIIYNLKP
jgi:hypothetical protein